MQEVDLSYKTAIRRRKCSLPTRFLLEEGLIRGRVLDFGCGRGFDASRLGIESYDPHFSPDYPEGKFDTIICHYVLNVIKEESARKKVLDQIRDLLGDGGNAYISIRYDLPKLKGTTKIGTWQGLIELDLPILVKKVGRYIIYHLTL
jgi:SAM-dependent methyltransferase